MTSSTSALSAGHDETSPLLTVTVPETAPLLTSTVDAATGLEAGGNVAGQDRDANGSSRQAEGAANMAVIFPAISIGVFLAATDATIALVSYATISSELDALNLASWIMTAYSLALASFQPLYGKLCDIFGCKQCLLAAYALFALGCLACGLAQSIEQLIAARVLQAIGGSGLGTVISILLTALVPSEDRGLWQGFLNIAYALGAGLGGPMGGLLATTVGWRWSFFGQVPFCLVALVLVIRHLDEDIGRPKDEIEQQTLASKLRRIDFLGSASLIVTIAALMLGLDRGSNVSWAATETYVSFAVSLAAAIWFLFVESYIAREPIVPLEIATSAGIWPAYTAAFFSFASILGLDFSLPLYYQARKQLTPQKASLILLPAILAGTSSALLTGFVMRRRGQYYYALILAAFVQTTGALGVFLFSGPAKESTVGLVISQVVAETGVGSSVVSGLLAIIANSSGSSIAISTALYYSIRNLGCVIGVSIVSTVIQQYLRSSLMIELQPFDVDVDAIVEAVRKSLESLDKLDPQIVAIVRECYGKAMTRGTLLILISASLVIIPVSMVRGGRKKTA